MPKKHTLHLIGNAHLDPIWLWRLGEGLAEIKATFRSALDRIREYPGFIFTSAAASYYKWIEENCPEMFLEIREAVRAGRWHIVGGMWVQPDCNMPSTESFVRHFLYSQHYFKEKFGVIARTGYNVDSFGHTGALPALLRGARIENYVFMRPAKGPEMAYPFAGNAFRWRFGEEEVLAFRLNIYSKNFEDDSVPAEYDRLTTAADSDFLMLYGVGNHGGGPTKKTIDALLSYAKRAENDLAFSTVDAFFDSLRESGDAERLPVFSGELQNVFSGCYAANSRVKKENRTAENLLGEAEVLGAMASVLTPYRPTPGLLTSAWQTLLFHQFHDVLCGCCIKSAHDEASDFMRGVAATARGAIHAATQRLSYAVNTSCGCDHEGKMRFPPVFGKLTPFVVFNPLSHAVTVPVHIGAHYIKSLTDEEGTVMPYQLVSGDQTVDLSWHKRTPGNQAIRFLAELPPLGWRLFWVHGETEYPKPVLPPVMEATPHRLANDRLTVTFDERTGGVSSLRTREGRELLGGASRAIVVKDESSTWGHFHYVFDEEIGEFSDPEFLVVEEGELEVSLRVRRYYKKSILEEIYTLYRDDARLHITGRLLLAEPLVRVTLTFPTVFSSPEWIREIPGGAISAETNGREMPHLRYMAMREGGCGLAVLNDSKYSVAADGGTMRMTLARSCHYADHLGPRHPTLPYQDLGEHEYRYVLMPIGEDITPAVHAAEELNTEFVTVQESYHEGPLSGRGSLLADMPAGISLMALKQAEDGQGLIARFRETAGAAARATVTLMGTSVSLDLAPHGIASFRLLDGQATPCDFLEWEPEK